jgi:protein-tyrosine kinase
MIRLTTPLIPFANRTSEPSHKRGSQLGRYFDALAGQLANQQLKPQGRAPAIGITSCLAAEGVSTIARNLAITFAQSRGQSTLLIDASGSGTDLTDVFGNQGSRTSDSHAENALSDCIYRTDVENLSVLATDSPSLPSVPMGSNEFQELIDECKEDFDLIVVDMPHADELSGCFAMSSALNGVVLVVEPEAVSAVDANRAKSRLQQAGANLMGVVINKEK